ncbi:ribonuclease H-like domain-containing protein [Trametes polyzona]|nr:ribonuclease H-like domain-containing protein [Trametes polyzona]
MLAAAASLSSQLKDSGSTSAFSARTVLSGTSGVSTRSPSVDSEAPPQLTSLKTRLALDTERSISKEPKLKKGGMGAIAVTLGREELRKRADFCILKLMCVRNLLPTIVDTHEWKVFVHELNPRYEPTSSTTFVDKHIPSEAAQVRLLQLEVLKGYHNLTLTYDGGSIRKPQSVYTVHITTPDRRVFFVEGDEASREHHTAEYVKALITRVIKRVGEDRFSGICSDNTGNTRKARELLVLDLPYIINLQDCCHQLHNTSKDITQLSDFRELVSSLRKIVKYFKKSNIAAAELSSARAEEGAGLRGLQSIGKTRFATVYWSANSLCASLPLIRRLVSSGKLVLRDVSFEKALLEEGTVAGMHFEIQLRRYISIVGPIARAIKSLEATDATAADVFVFWHSIAATSRDLLGRPETETSITPVLAEKIRGIINKRFKEIIDQAPTDVYFTTFFLHPKYARADILAKPTSISNTIIIPAARTGRTIGTSKAPDDDSRAAPNPRAHRRATEFLKKQLRNELKRNADHFALRGKKPSDVVQEFRRQLLAYAKGEWPFNAPLDEARGDGRPVMQWWRDIAEHPHAQILAMLAIKLYSIAVNSMADERTASNFTWFNTALRNHQNVGTLVNMIQIRQWYLNAEEFKERPPRTAPTVSWANIDKSLLERRLAAEEELSDDEFFREWPALSDPSGTKAAGGPTCTAEADRAEDDLKSDEFKADDQLDLCSATLRTLLGDRFEEEESDTESDGLYGLGSHGSPSGRAGLADGHSGDDVDDEAMWDF